MRATLTLGAQARVLLLSRLCGLGAPTMARY